MHIIRYYYVLMQVECRSLICTFFEINTVHLIIRHHGQSCLSVHGLHGLTLNACWVEAYLHMENYSIMLYYYVLDCIIKINLCSISLGTYIT